MATQCYDCFFLFDSNKFNRDPGGVAAKTHKLIEDLGGEILASRLWEERKLAFLVNGQSKGTYWISYFNMDSSKLTEFNRACKLDENILRHLVIKVDPRLVETLVNHTLGKSTGPVGATITEDIAIDEPDIVEDE
ncbi:MAG TPA: 30S ribosomal protein S6 [Planctomycetaceae bacterium]|nr:30S ribosomal protein S6 [Planctomycetaceae bacterium]